MLRIYKIAILPLIELRRSPTITGVRRLIFLPQMIRIKFCVKSVKIKWILCWFVTLAKWGMSHYINWIENKMKLGWKKDSGDIQDLTKRKCCCFLICSNFVIVMLIVFCYVWLIYFFHILYHFEMHPIEVYQGRI